MNRWPAPVAEASSDAESERLLIERVGRGDREAFRLVYFAYHRRLNRFLVRFLRSRERIDEVINDTLYAVWCQAAGFRGASRVSTWIFGIAYRKALHALRTEAREAPREWTEGPSSDAEDPEPRRRELRECLDRALASLPDAQRLVVELAYYTGHSCEEIAVITGSPVNTIKTRLFHARLRLRELLPELREER